MDDGLVERFRYLTAEVLRLIQDCAAHSWTIGAHLSEVKRTRLYAVAGIGLFDDYLATHVKIERSQAYKWIAVAENYSRDLAARLGVEVCYAYLRHIRATPEDDRPADIARATIRVPLEDGQVIEKPVVDATSGEIAAATRLLKESGVPEWPAEARDLYARLRGALPDEVRVALSLEEGKVTFSLSGIPASRACDLLAMAGGALGCVQ